MEGDIGHENQSGSTFLTEPLSAPGSDKRAIEEWNMIRPLAREFAPGLCVCGCRQLYWSIGSWLAGHIPDEAILEREIRRLRTEIKQQPKKHQSYQLGAREFTLTYSPKWFDDNEARRLMVRAIDKLIKYHDNEIINLRAVGEVGTNGLSHVHCFYKLTGGLKITDKNFKRAWKFWNPKKRLQNGFEGGHHATVKNESDFLGYIDKDADTAWLDKSFSRENNINAD